MLYGFLVLIEDNHEKSVSQWHDLKKYTIYFLCILYRFLQLNRFAVKVWLSAHGGFDYCEKVG